MKPDKYRGIISIFYICYNRTGEVSGDGVRALTRYFVDQGVKGIHVGGSSGECIYQSVEDRKKTLEAVMGKAVGRLTVIAHVACNNIRDGRILAAHAQSLGMDGITAIPSIYFRLPEYSVAGYWNDISEAAPGTSSIVYNISQLTGTVLTMSFLRITLLNGRIVGVKNSSMPVRDIQMFKAEVVKTREDFIMFNGSNEQPVSGLAMGADGGIGGTYGVTSGLFLKICDLVSGNGMTEARAIQYDADETMYELCSGTCNMYVVIKEVLRVSRRIDIEGVRKPLTDLCDGDWAVAGEATAMIEAVKEKYC